jgi:hypothetical protein
VRALSIEGGAYQLAEVLDIDACLGVFVDLEDLVGGVEQIFDCFVIDLEI